MEEESHPSSAAAFVEGGVQDACEDACSICLEEFSDRDPSAVTSCKHEFHLQCVLEWCQRSSQCPMCWQSISLKDPTSQELLEAVEQERSFRVKRSHNTTIFHRSTLEDFGLRQLPIDLDDAALEERIFQHLAAAAAMGRVRRITRREGQRGISGAPAISSANPSAPLATAEVEPSSQALHISADQVDQVAILPPENIVTATSNPTISHSRFNWSSTGHSAPVGQDIAGPSDFTSFSETFKSRLSAVSMRYKESFTRSTQGWKEKLLSRSTSIADIGSDVKREVNTGMATVSRLIERLDMRESTRAASDSTPHIMRSHSVNKPSNENITERDPNTIPNDNSTSTSAAGNPHLI